MNRAEILRIASIIFVAVTFVVIGDTAGKLLTSSGVDPFFVAWTRFSLAAILLWPLSRFSLSELLTLKDWRVLVRAVFITCGIVFILTALKTEPIADVFGAFFIGPVVSYILAVLFLGEKPSFIRTCYLILGFLGVLLVVKPNFNISAGMVFALAAGTCYGSYLVMTRTVAGFYRPRLLLMSQLMIGAFILTPLGLTVELPTLNTYLIVLVAISALGSAVGNYLLVVASKSAEASLIAPLVYSQLISATVIGVLVFGDWPDVYSTLGLILIAISGAGSLIASHPKILFGRTI